MRRFLINVSIALAAVVSLAFADHPPPTPGPMMVPDKGWEPVVGDQAIVYLVDAPSVADAAKLPEIAKALEANEGSIVADLVASGKTVMVAANSSIRVIEVSGLPPKRPVQVLSQDEAYRITMEAAITSPTGPRYGVSVRGKILDGPLKGQTRWFSMVSLASMIDKMPEPGQVAKGDRFYIVEPGADLGDDWTAFQGEGRSTDYRRRLDPKRTVLAAKGGTKVSVLDASDNPMRAVKVKVAAGSKGAGKIGWVARSALLVPVPDNQPPR